MMRALYDDERSRLLRVSIMLVCGASAVLPFSIAPGTAVGRATTVSHRLQIPVPSIPDRLEFPSLEIARDPFVPDEGEAPLGVHDRTSGVQAEGGDDEPIVRGVVLGDVPQALVELNGKVEVLGIGDGLASATIKSIDGGGVTLSNGTHLTLAEDSR